MFLRSPRTFVLCAALLVLALVADAASAFATETAPVILAQVPVGRNPRAIAVDPTTDRVYVANFDGQSVSVFQGATNQPLMTVPAGGYPYGIGVNPASHLVYVPSVEEDLVRVRDGANLDLVATIAVGDYPEAVAVDPGTNRIYVTNTLANTVSVIDGASNTVVATVPVGRFPDHLDIDATTHRIYVSTVSSDAVSVIDGTTNAVVATVPVGRLPEGIAVDPLSNRAYVANNYGSSVSVVDTDTNLVIATIPLPGRPVGITLNPATGRVYVGLFLENLVVVIDEATNTSVASTVVATNPFALATHPTTGRVYVAGFDDQRIITVLGAPDATPPTVVPVLTDTLGLNGWYTSAVAVSWQVQDPESPIVSTSGCGATAVNADTAGTTFTCTATSQGGATTGSVTVKRDATAPHVECDLADGGWHPTNVAIPCTASDAVSHLANPAQGSFSLSTNVPEGEQTTFAETGTLEVCDAAGNCATAGPNGGHAIDRQPPLVSTSVSPPPNAAGWYTSVPVTVTFVCDSNLGSPLVVGNPPTYPTTWTHPVALSSNGIDLSATVTCQDLMGNTAIATVASLRIDSFAPVLIVPNGVSAIATGQSGALVSFAASATDNLDTAPTVACSPASGSVFPLGATNVACTASDQAGNTTVGSFAVTVVDPSPPTIAPVLTGTLGSNGWYTSDVAVSWQVQDFESPIGSTSGCAAATVDADTTGVTFTCTAASAGGTATSSVTVKRDATAPAVSTSRTPPNPNGWNQSSVVVSASGTDATSGVATCTTATVTAEGAGQSATVSCADAAGNVGYATVTGINVDKTAPVLNLPSPFGVNAVGPSGAVVTYVASATDNLDGSPTVACTPASNTVFPIGPTLASCAATDKAGNSVTGSFTVTVKDGATQIQELKIKLSSTSVSNANSKDKMMQWLVDALDFHSQNKTIPQACQKLDKFVEEVNQAKANGWIGATAADALIQDANRIKAVWGC